MANIELDQVNWTRVERDEHAVKGWRSRRAGEFPLCASIVRPASYVHDLDRGIVEYDPAWRNYSYHKVRIGPDTIVRGGNFTQNQPDTDAIIITGPPDSVTFIDCNMVNVRVKPGWILQGCNTSQSWLVQTGVDADGNDIEERQWLCSHPSELTAPMLVSPANAVTSRAF